MRGRKAAGRDAALLREALRERGMGRLTQLGVRARTWLRVLRNAGVAVEWHLTGDYHPFEPVEEEVWVPAWAKRLVWFMERFPHVEPRGSACDAVLRRATADEELQRAILAEEALGGAALVSELVAPVVAEGGRP